MDYFALFLDVLCITGQGMMHIIFASRLTGKKQKLWYFAAYILLLGVLQLVSTRFSLSEIPFIVVGVLALYAISRFWMGNQPSVSWLAAVLAFYIPQLSFGIINSVEAALFPRFIGSPLLYLLLIAAQALFFGLCICCYHAVLKLLTWTEDSHPPLYRTSVVSGSVLLCRGAVYSPYRLQFFCPCHFSGGGRQAQYAAAPASHGPGGAAVYPVRLPPAVPGFSGPGGTAIADPGGP